MKTRTGCLHTGTQWLRKHRNSQISEEANDANEGENENGGEKGEHDAV